MNIIKSKLEGVLLIESDVYPDDRGFFFESYNETKYIENGIECKFVQDNHSASTKNILRGLHYQIPPFAQAKLVRAGVGEVFDVAVDLRKDSPTFLQWDGYLLSAENKRQLFIPKGFAHGFCVISDYAEFLYKCDEFYSPKHDRGLMWNDPAINIDWPVGAPVLSPKDSNHQYLNKNSIAQLPF